MNNMQKSEIRASNFLSIVIVFVLLTILISSPIRAQSPTLKTSTPAASPSEVIDKLKQIKILKEKIATKVAEIREKDKKAIFGTVKKMEQSTIAVASREKDQSVSFSDDTLFFSIGKEGKSQTSAKKIKEGDTVSAYGYLSEENALLSAKFIYLETPTLHLAGKIADIDNKNYTITISSPQGNQVVDVETSTRTFIYTKDKTKKAAGFSKLKIGDIVHVLGSPNLKEVNRMSASRILVMTSLTQATPTPTKVATPSATLP